MFHTPQLSEATVQEIPAGHLFLSRNDEGVEVIYLMLDQGTTTPETFTVVQMQPRSTSTSWSATLPPDRLACDVNDSYVLSYAPLVDNFQFVELPVLSTEGPTNTPAHMTTGQLALIGNRTCLVILGVNPAIGYGLIDIATGEFVFPGQPFPQFAIVVQKWEIGLKP
jgi:hypothetical protein